MIKIIAAASFNGVIGQKNTIPWSYPEDMAFFRKMTSGSTVIMGRRTFESIGRLLPKRRNIILTNRIVPKMDIPGADIFHSLDRAIETCEDNVWIIGGSYVYQEALRFVDEIYITTIPEIITGEGLVYFPYINPDAFTMKNRIELSKDKNLYCNMYSKI